MKLAERPGRPVWLTRRANEAEKQLVKLGIDKSRLKTISFGKEKLEVVSDTELAHAQNRVAITVIN